MALTECPRCGTLLLPTGTTVAEEDPTPLPFESSSAPGPDAATPVRTRTTSATVLGEFRLVRKLGEGAMGAVYKARQVSQNGRDVALKVLFRHVAKKPRCVERFYREARVMMQLDHPNIVRGYQVGEDHGLNFFAMEYVSGCSLQQWINRHGPLGVGEALHIALAIARALGYAHGRDLIHRDIKPDNVLLGFPPDKTASPSEVVPVQVKITDLGMAKVLDDALDLTQTGYGVGTPCYMPLEQARNSKEVDGRCDIYALGCLLYCCLTGQPPFTGATLLDLVQAKEANNFRPARRFNPEVPQRLDLIIYRMVAKNPRDRHQTCAEVIRDLESLQLAHPTLCLPRPETAPLRPGGDADSGSSEPAGPTPDRVSSADVRTRVVNLDEEGIASGRSGSPPEAPALNVWFVRIKTPEGRVVRTMTTAEVLDLIAGPRFDPSIQASRQADAGFRSLAGYREFKAAVLPRVTRAAADERSGRLRSLVQRMHDEDKAPAVKPGSAERPGKDAAPPGLPISWQTLAVIGGGIVLLAGLVILVLKLIEIFG